MCSFISIHRFAYVEFAEPEFVDPAVALDNSLFHGRLIKVCVDRSVWHDACPDNIVLARLWQKGPMYQGSTEDEDGGEAATEVVIGVAFEEVEGATAHTGAVAGTSLFDDNFMSCGLTGHLTVDEGVATNSWRIENINPCCIPTLPLASYSYPL